MIKDLVRNIFSILGYEVSRKESAGFNAAYLSKICAPKTVFDVGVAGGTPELYKAFPAARFFLVDPVSDFKRALAAVPNRAACRVYPKAAGERPGVMKLNVEKDPALSSLKARPRADVPQEEREVEVITLDQIKAENPDLQGPVLVKVDVEGAELDVLRGAQQLLSITDTVIVEVSIAKRFENSCSFEDVVLFMKEKGFRVFDFLSVCRGNAAGGANMADAVFKKSAISGEAE